MPKACTNKKIKYLLPFGTYETDGVIFHTVSFPKAKNCKLCLFDRSGALIDKVPMERDRNGIFSVSVKKTDYLYCFEADEEMLADPYAKVFMSGCDFGKRCKSLLSGVTAMDVARGKNLLPYEKHTISELVLYEIHVRNFTRSETSGVKCPGTFKGVSEKAGYLKKLGISGVLLLPIYDFNECEIPGRLNTWGFTEKETFYFSPKQAYAYDAAKPEQELLDMVSSLHKAQIDVYMDVHFPHDVNYRFAADCLRHYSEQFGIDGFRLNVGREMGEALLLDPYLINCRFFLNDIRYEVKRDNSERAVSCDFGFRDNVRKYIKGDENLVLTVFDYFKNRSAANGVRCITGHNGFTLNDLYSYDVKHNEDNGENNRDGEEYNFSWNCGEEGPSVSKKVNALRLKMIKNALVTLLLSGGIPMLSAGDEFGNSQSGNNNPYCLDNEKAYVDWSKSKFKTDIEKFTAFLIELRKKNDVFSVEESLSENRLREGKLPEISVHGVTPWKVDRTAYNRLFAMYFCGKNSDSSFDDDFYIIYNMHWEEHSFMVPVMRGMKFEIFLSTDKTAVFPSDGKETAVVPARSILILKGENNEKRH